MLLDARPVLRVRTHVELLGIRTFGLRPVVRVQILPARAVIRERARAVYLEQLQAVAIVTEL